VLGGLIKKKKPPTYNHTREDSHLMPCPQCASTEAEKELAERLLDTRIKLSRERSSVVAFLRSVPDDSGLARKLAERIEYGEHEVRSDDDD
jgi:hypothetical protein